MDIDKIYIAVAQKVATKAIDYLFSSVGSLVNDSTGNQPRRLERDHIERKLYDHLCMISAWSEKFIFYRMSTPMDVDKKTIKLSLRTIPRRYSDKAASKLIREEDLLRVSENVVLLGDPGSGKTTTLKRIARSLMTNDSLSENDRCQYPILVRFNFFNQSVAGKDILVRIIADEIGIQYESENDQYYVTNNEENSYKIKDYEHKNEKTLLRQAIPTILDNTLALVLLDGLDEVSTDFKRQIEKEIQDLSLATNQAKIILTCRTGDYNRPIGYFKEFEVNALSDKEIRQVVSKWLGKKKNEFMEKLESLPYSEFTSRPLFLTQLLVLYCNVGYLPQQPQDIYRMILMLMIREWDEERGLRRISKYAWFVPERKLDFLSHLAYELTYRIQSKQFSTKILIEVYEKIHRQFLLPENEAEQVAREIESHTGIIIESGYNKYEFSHLTLQEFLCAHYLARSPLAPSLASNYLKKYPAPLAVATAYSSDPSSWLSIVLLNNANYKISRLPNLLTLMTRIVIEKPCFSVNTLLGYCILYLVFSAHRIKKDEISMAERLRDVCSKLVKENAEVKESVINALCSYRVVLGDDVRGDCSFQLRAMYSSSNEYDVFIPDIGEMDFSFLEFLIENSWVSIEDLSRED